MNNGGVFKVIGAGNVCLQTNMGMQLLLRGVKHASNVCFSLIFVHTCWLKVSSPTSSMSVYV